MLNYDGMVSTSQAQSHRLQGHTSDVRHGQADYGRK